MPTPAEIVYELSKLKRSVSEMIWASIKEDRREQRRIKEEQAVRAIKTENPWL